MKKYWIAVIGIILAGVAVQYILQSSGGPGSPKTTPRPGAPEERITTTTDTSGWQSYTNTKLGISAKYPPGATLRGTTESDLAIITLDRATTDNKSAMITLTKKKVPLNQAPYPDMETFWKDEQAFLASQGGVVSNERYVEVNDRSFFEAREDNRQINYMGLHRYLRSGDAIYEISLTIEGEKLLAESVARFNDITASFTIQ